MTEPQIEIQFIAIVVAVACAVPGVFLVLRRVALLSDAISHSILPGIVIAFFLTSDLSSPLLMLGATMTGVLTVFLVELLSRTGRVKEDAAIGLVFPFLFSIGVILIARFAGNVHLDTDAVLLGELAFAPFDRLVVLGWDVGPRSLFVMLCILVLNVAFVALLYKELKLSTFDTALAAALGFAPGLIHYGLMVLVSLTAVGAFDAVGSVLVVAFMIAPPAAAYLLVNRLSSLIYLSAGFAAASAIIGYWIAHLLDASIAGCMASVAGLIFALCYLLAPDQGLVALARRRVRQRREFALQMLAIHLFNHEGLPESARENRIEHLTEHLRWPPGFAGDIVQLAERRAWVNRYDGSLTLTDRGRQAARSAVVQ